MVIYRCSAVANFEEALQACTGPKPGGGETSRIFQASAQARASYWFRAPCRRRSPSAAEEELHARSGRLHRDGDDEERGGCAEPLRLEEPGAEFVFGDDEHLDVEGPVRVGEGGRGADTGLPEQ